MALRPAQKIMRRPVQKPRHWCPPDFAGRPALLCWPQTPPLRSSDPTEENTGAHRKLLRDLDEGRSWAAPRETRGWKLPPRRGALHQLTSEELDHKSSWEDTCSSEMTSSSRLWSNHQKRSWRISEDRRTKATGSKRSQARWRANWNDRIRSRTPGISRVREDSIPINSSQDSQVDPRMIETESQLREAFWIVSGLDKPGNWQSPIRLRGRTSSDATKTETAPNWRLSLKSWTTGGPSSAKEEPALGRTPELARRHNPREDQRSRGETKAKS